MEYVMATIWKWGCDIYDTVPMSEQELKLVEILTHIYSTQWILESGESCNVVTTFSFHFNWEEN